MIELLFLLLPLAAAYGWYMGRSSVKNKRADSKSHQNHNYIRGVEYLLNNDRELAVDRFIAYLNEADPSFETNLALGNLFRKRGEVDKAISLHQAVLSNPKLDISEHELAKLELGRDFMSAGLLDRAEAILTELVEIPRQRTDGARLLIKLYEQERDYPQAIATALKYREALGPANLSQLSQYYCETAQQDLARGDAEKARAAFTHALDVYPDSIRARLGLCEILLRSQQGEEAYKLIKEVSALSADTGLICLDDLLRCFPNKADPQLRFALDDLVRRTKSAQAMVELTEVVEQTSGRDDAELMLLNFVKEKPNLKLFSALMRLRSKDSGPAANEAILQLKSLVDAQIASNHRYACHRCGFQSQMLFWQCPSCRRWDTMKPIRGLDGD